MQHDVLLYNSLFLSTVRVSREHKHFRLETHEGAETFILSSPSARGTESSSASRTPLQLLSSCNDGALIQMGKRAIQPASKGWNLARLGHIGNASQCMVARRVGDIGIGRPCNGSPLQGVEGHVRDGVATTLKLNPSQGKGGRIAQRHQGQAYVCVPWVLVKF